MRIGELAQATGASVRALRYYEEQGLLEPGRSASGQRHYRPEAVEQVQWIRMLLSAGLPTRAILKLSPCESHRSATPEETAVVRQERGRVDEQLKKLAAIRDRLDTMLAWPNEPAAANDNGLTA